MQPSFSTQVNKSSEQYFSASFAAFISGIPLVSFQPLIAIIPSIASTEMMILCFPIVSASSSRKALFKISPFARSSPVAQAALPMMTFSAPSEISSFACFALRIPPPTLTLLLCKRDFRSSVFAVVTRPFASVSVLPIAASRSIIAVSPNLSKSLMSSSALSRSKIFSFPFLS